MEFDVVISGVKAEIVGSECITVLFDRPLKTLSSVFFKGGFVEARSILNMHVPKSYDHEDPEGDVRRRIEKLGLPKPVIGMMTAAEMENVAVANKEEEQGELAVTAIVTAGISNAVTAGERPRFPSLENTINVILLVDANLSLGAMIGSVMVATEAKTIALRELDIRSFSMDSDYGLLTNLASGTTTDSVTVSCTSKGEMISFNTSGIELGRLIGLAVKEAVLEGLEKQEKINAERPLLDRLEERGISIEYLIKIAEDHYFPLISKEDRENDRYREDAIKKELEELLSCDQRVCSLVIAGLGLEEDKKRLGLLTYKTEIRIQKEINEGANRDPDLFFGEIIAEYIGRSKGSQLYRQSVENFKKSKQHIPLKEDMPLTMYYILLGIVGGTIGRI